MGSVVDLEIAEGLLRFRLWWEAKGSGGMRNTGIMFFAVGDAGY
jgi:hypothetical protein